MNRAAALLALLLLAGTGGRSPVDIDAPLPGSGDVTDEINAAIEQAPPGTASRPTLVRFPSGTHRVDGTVEVFDAEHLIVDGGGGTWQTQAQGDDQRKHVQIHDSADVALRNVVVDGPNDDYRPDGALVSEFQAGVQVRGSDGVRVHHVEVRDVYGDGVNVLPRGDDWSTRVRVKHVAVLGAARQGVFVGGGRTVRITRSRFDRIGRNVFSLEPAMPGHGYADVLIAHNRIGTAGGRMAAVTGHDGTTGRDVEIRGNVGVESPLSVYVGGTSNKRGVTVTGNRSDLPARADHRIKDGRDRAVVTCRDPVPGLRVEGNAQPTPKGMSMVEGDC